MQIGQQWIIWISAMTSQRFRDHFYWNRKCIDVFPALWKLCETVSNRTLQQSLKIRSNTTKTINNADISILYNGQRQSDEGHNTERRRTNWMTQLQGKNLADMHLL